MEEHSFNPSADRSCPCCGRAFREVADFPRVRVISFDRLPTPEAIDDLSDAAARKAIEWHRQHPHERDGARGGINMTPEIEEATRRPEVVAYLDCLAGFAGQEIEPREVFPPWPADGYFKKAHPIADTRIYLSLHEGEATPAGDRTTHIEALCKGVNFGSAGGPTLAVLGAIARITYRGLLVFT